MMRRNLWVLLATAGLAGCPHGGNNQKECGSDADCGGIRVCRDGACQDGSASSSSSAGSGASSADSGDSSSAGSSSATSGVTASSSAPSRLDGGTASSSGSAASLGDGGSAGNQAPVARCPNPVGNELEVAPLDTIWLDCSASTDPEGTPLTYAWTEDARPPGSTATVQSPSSARTRFFVDLATPSAEPYRFRCTVSDGVQQDSCSVTVFAIPRDLLHVQLVWDKDGVDVDLHVMDVANADGGWFSLPGDCYYMNRTADWGLPGNTRDNPRLDIDDTNGFGPENINISQPATGTYRIGAHYFCDDDAGVTQATVRVYCGGQPAGEYTQELAGSGAFWDAVDVGMPGCTLTPLGATRQVSQGCTASASACNPTTCLGCCFQNTCLPGTQDQACGTGGAACADCTTATAPACANSQCNLGAPDAGSAGDGGAPERG